MRTQTAASYAAIAACVVIALLVLPVVPSSPQDLRLCSAQSCPNRTPMSVSASVTWAAFHVGTVIVVSLGTFNQYCWVEGADMGSSCVAWQSAPLR